MHAIYGFAVIQNWHNIGCLLRFVADTVGGGVDGQLIVGTVRKGGGLVPTGYLRRDRSSRRTLQRSSSQDNAHSQEK